MTEQQLLEHLANFFMTQFNEDLTGMAEHMAEDEGIEDIAAFVATVQTKTTV